ncbi:hypothetical protein LINPERHAP1_LOCUS26111 [Linum perenne]
MLNLINNPSTAASRIHVLLRHTVQPHPHRNSTPLRQQVHNHAVVARRQFPHEEEAAGDALRGGLERRVAGFFVWEFEDADSINRSLSRSLSLSRSQSTFQSRSPRRSESIEVVMGGS